MIETNTRYYADKVAQKHEGIHPDTVNHFCLYMMRQVFGNLIRGREVLIAAGPRKTKIKIYKRDFNVKRANDRAIRQRRKLFKERAERKNEKHRNQHASAGAES